LNRRRGRLMERNAWRYDRGACRRPPEVILPALAILV
jgi:hypothetical protein